MRVPLVDLRAQHAGLRSELRAAMDAVCDAGAFVLGETVAGFEREASSRLDGVECVGVSSGSDALLIAMMALGVGPGDEVVTTPFSFFATTEAIVRIGATPRFVDVEPDTLNIDPGHAARAISKKTKALLVVHVFGRPARIEDLKALAETRRVALVEDAAQAFGVAHEGRSLGTWGAVGCFSFFPAKPLGAMGDAGLIAASDPTLVARFRRLRGHGAVAKHVHTEVGGNFRLDALQAAVLRVKLPHVDRFLAARRAHAMAYTHALKDVDELEVPIAPEAKMPVASYTVRLRNGRRDEAVQYLASQGIETAVHYPRPLHQQPALAYLGYGAGSFPEAERAAREVLSLPLYPELTAEQQDHVVECVRRFMRAC